jgi:hypothetical protein
MWSGLLHGYDARLMIVRRAVMSRSAQGKLCAAAGPANHSRYTKVRRVATGA